MSRGLMGKILWVDLSRRELRDEELSSELGRQFFGGYGLGSRLLYSHQKAGVNPLGPQNTLGFFTGPATGTAMLGSARYAVVGKSPLTGGWGDSNSGGYFGPHLKFAGYDALLFTGISEKPVYLFVNNGKAEIRDAAYLWGKDTYETEDTLKAELGSDIKVACIGPAGEKMALVAAIINDRGRAAGRSGLGAVMGSKKLKAVVVKGNMKIPVHDEKSASDLRKKYITKMGGPGTWMGRYGTAYTAYKSSHNGDSPVKNWGGVGVVDFPDNQSLHVDNFEARKIKKYACYRCNIGCGAHMRAGSGEYIYEEGCHRPEYETIAMFGSNCLNNNIESIIKINDICNRHGLDTISTGASIAFTIECYENGLINKSDTDSLEMTWGNHRSIISMTEKLAKREGFGDIIADGVKIAADKIGKGADKYAIHINGQELPAHDPKEDRDWGIAYTLDPTPGRHTQNAFLFQPYELGTESSEDNIGRDYRTCNAWLHVVNSAGICIFVFSSIPHTDVFIEFMRAITGYDLTSEELIKTGERILNMRQAFNIREGLNPPEFKMPERMIGNPPQQAGPLKDKTFDTNLCTRCLTAADWDLKTAKPSKNKLIELGLSDVAKDLWPKQGQ
jgi:aldehyde:ferredoxin oxidoreductase